VTNIDSTNSKFSSGLIDYISMNCFHLSFTY